MRWLLTLGLLWTTSLKRGGLVVFLRPKDGGAPNAADE